MFSQHRGSLPNLVRRLPQLLNLADKPERKPEALISFGPTTPELAIADLANTMFYPAIPKLGVFCSEPDHAECIRCTSQMTLSTVVSKEARWWRPAAE